MPPGAWDMRPYDNTNLYHFLHIHKFSTNFFNCCGGWEEARARRVQSASCGCLHHWLSLPRTPLALRPTVYGVTVRSASAGRPATREAPGVGNGWPPEGGRKDNIVAPRLYVGYWCETLPSVVPGYRQDGASGTAGYGESAY